MTRTPALLIAMLTALLTGCGTLPPLEGRKPSSALEDTAGTRLGRALARDVAAHPAKTGIYVLDEARDAFAARGLLAEAADRSLDVQYYIWHGDQTGWLLFEALWRAAERGVRVRLLLDDNGVGGLDGTLAALDAHSNIEVRLYNPFVQRRARALGYLTDFERVNRRMHNKSFTADNQATIVGGRNVGDEYYGANMEVGFQDLDVLGIGPVVQQVSNEFDLFWNSASAYPAATVLAPAKPESTAMLREAWDRVHQNPEAVQYVEAVRKTPLMVQLAGEKLDFEWTIARVLHDDPAKVLQPMDRSDLQMLPQLLKAMGHPKRELDLVSPYFVPGADGTKSLVELAQNGVTVRVLTNSLSATDVSPVHAGYSKYRNELLKGGAVLYELKPGSAVPPPDKDKDEDRARGLPGSGSRASSAASLHAKTFAVDRERIFVGSYNLDPRSSKLNTEMGVVIESPALAGMLSKQFDTSIPTRAYLVRRQSDGRGLEWIDVEPTGETRYSSEPGAGPVKRLWIDFLEVLPIEWLL